MQEEDAARRYLHLHGTYIVAVQRLTGEKDMDILNDLRAPSSLG